METLEGVREGLIELLKVLPSYKLLEAQELLEGLIHDGEGVLSLDVLKVLRAYELGETRSIPNEEVDEYLRKLAREHDEFSTGEGR